MSDKKPSKTFSTVKVISVILMIFAVLLSGCSYKEFPDVPLYVLDINHQVCAKYSFVDKERLTVKHDEDLPINNCEGMIGFGYKDYNETVKPWIREAIQKLKNKQPIP